MRQCTMFALAVLLGAVLAPARALSEPTPAHATEISLTCTLVPGAVAAVAFVSDNPELGWTVLAAGVLLGPATGYIYGDHAGRGFAGVGIRAGCGLLGMMGFGMAMSEADESPTGAFSMLAGGIGIAGSMIWDLAAVGSDVRKHNASRSSVGLEPLDDRDASRIPSGGHGGAGTVGRLLGHVLDRERLAGPGASERDVTTALDREIWGALARRHVAEQRIEVTPAEIDEVLRAARVTGPIAPGERAQVREYARAAVLLWKLNRSLYERYGGIVVARPLDPMQPAGAYRSFLEDMEKQQAFEITDAALRTAFWERHPAEPPLPLPAGDVNFETPWWVQPPAVALR